MKGFPAFYTIRDIKTLHKAVKAMSTQTDMQRNKLIHLENTLVMYGIHNVETLEKLVKTVHALQSRQTLYESFFTGKTSAAVQILFTNVWFMWHTALCN